jgi:hypothetical protein
MQPASMAETRRRRQGREGRRSEGGRDPDILGECIEVHLAETRKQSRMEGIPRENA